MLDQAVPSVPSVITVLLIDAYKADREYWAQRLRISSPDYAVLEADNGEAGLAICLSQHVDCVLPELTLPDMSGFKILINLVPRAFHPKLAVIFLSRTSLPPMAGLAKTNGAQAYLVKSQITGDHLDMAIRKAIATVAPNRKEPRR